MYIRESTLFGPFVQVKKNRKKRENQKRKNPWKIIKKKKYKNNSKLFSVSSC